jgi:N-acetylmuramoyl-L-alanine amidase
MPATVCSRPLAALLPLLALLLSACASVPPDLRGTALPREWLASPNFEHRRPNYVILHHTSNDNPERALATLTTPERAVSAHYLITREGALVQLVDERMRAWHAGESYWGGQTDMNSASIGIELDNTGSEPFPEPQMATLLSLLSDLRERYRIPAANVIGHSDVAPRRKADPSHLFPWKRLAEQGFGLWCEAPAEAAPPHAPTALLLRAIGYDTRDLPAAVLAFRRHYFANPSLVATDAEMDADERAMAWCLAKQRG